MLYQISLTNGYASTVDLGFVVDNLNTDLIMLARQYDQNYFDQDEIFKNIELSELDSRNDFRSLTVSALQISNPNTHLQRSIVVPNTEIPYPVFRCYGPPLMACGAEQERRRGYTPYEVSSLLATIRLTSLLMGVGEYLVDCDGGMLLDTLTNGFSERNFLLERSEGNGEFVPILGKKE